MPWYVYGVTRLTAETSPPDLRGVDDAPVELVGSGDLQAVVGKVAASFRDVASAPDAEVLDAVRRHDDVLKEMVRQRPLLPVRFGTLLSDDAALAALLADTDGRLRRALDHVADAAEWVITVTVVASFDDLPDQDEQAQELTPGHAFFARRRSAAAQRQQHRADAIDLANGMHTRLQAVARDFRPLDVRDADTVARGAYLVPRAATRRFVEAVHSDGAARVEVQGPLPPYRFTETGT